jgi:hypothetical protein
VVTTYDQFVGRPLGVGEQVPAHDYDKVARAQAIATIERGRVVDRRPARYRVVVRFPSTDERVATS